MVISNKKKIVFFLFLGFLIFYSLLSNQAQALTIITPTITSIAATSPSTTTIKGTTIADTDVMLFLDNKFIGSVAANLAANSSNITGFSYVLEKDLSDGQHVLTAIAHDSKTQIISDYSRPFIFIVAEKKEISLGVQTNNTTTNLPSAPVLQDPPLVNHNGQLVVAGWAKNNLKINIYFDEKLLTSFPVSNSKTGTASFAYPLRQTLTNGGHLIYSTATDNSHNESIRSNYLYYLAGAANNNEVLPNNSQGATVQNKPEPLKISEKEKTASNNDQELSDILQQKQAVSREKSGMVDERRQMQGRLNWNLIIFILFLIAVIAWIFWINRELIKEKKERNKKVEETNSQDKLV